MIRGIFSFIQDITDRFTYWMLGGRNITKGSKSQSSPREAWNITSTNPEGKIIVHGTSPGDKNDFLKVWGESMVDDGLSAQYVAEAATEAKSRAEKKAAGVEERTRVI